MSDIEVDADRLGDWIHKTVNSDRNPQDWFNPEGAKGWQTIIEKWLSDYNVDAAELHGSIASGVDVHLWMKPSQKVGLPKLYVDSIPGNAAVGGLLTLLNREGGVEIGYSAGTPVLWVVTTTKPDGRP